MAHSKSREKQSKTNTSQIAETQWKLPAGFTADGKLASLRDVVEPDVHTLSLSDLTPEQTKDLVAARISAQPKYDLVALGAGNIDKDRAIAEVKAGTPLGQTLMEIEQRYINDLVSHAQETEKSGG